MWRVTRPLGSIDKLIIAENAEFFGDFEQRKVSNPREKTPWRNIHGMAFYKAIARGLVESNQAISHLFRAFCKEHNRYELVAYENYIYDLHFWYDAGVHPRFSVLGALIGAKQRERDIRALIETNWRVVDGMSRRSRLAITEALKMAKTPEEFIKTMRPYLFTHLSLGGRRPRVTNTFKERYLRKDFTVKEFFREQNQELRRIMLRILPIAEILKGLKFVAEDEEGKLYDFDRGNDRPSWDRNDRYLYVKCPSTGQEYLLGVPETMKTPKEARRWTFRLDTESKFVKEA